MTILKQAKTVKDTLDVSEKLNGVRGEIEQQQPEFEVLSKQVETVAITISLHSEADANVFGLQWRPLYELKLAAMQGPRAVLGWKLLRLGARVLFTAKKTASLPVVSS